MWCFLLYFTTWTLLSEGRSPSRAQGLFRHTHTLEYGPFEGHYILHGLLNRPSLLPDSYQYTVISTAEFPLPYEVVRCLRLSDSGLSERIKDSTNWHALIRVEIPRIQDMVFHRKAGSDRIMKEWSLQRASPPHCYYGNV